MLEVGRFASLVVRPCYSYRRKRGQTKEPSGRKGETVGFNDHRGGRGSKK